MTADGHLLTWGRNHAGQLALGRTGDVTEPARAVLPAGVRAKAVDTGHGHMVVVTDRGKVLVFGADSTGHPFLKQEVAWRASWGSAEKVRVGEDFTLVATDRGTVLAWGGNREGQLGTGDRRDRHEPTLVGLPTDAGRVLDLWAGTRSAAVRTANGIYSWGAAAFGQTGQGHRLRPNTRPQRITQLGGAKLTALFGGKDHAVAIATHGPARALHLTPDRAVARAEEHVSFEVHALDAFGNDLGPTTGIAGLEHLTLHITDGHAVGTTVRATTPGAHLITAHAGHLTGSATLVIKNGK